MPTQCKFKSKSDVHADPGGLAGPGLPYALCINVTAQFMVRGFLNAELVFEFNFVSLGYSGKLEDDMRFTRCVHGRPTHTMVVKVYEKTWLLAELTVTSRHVNEREFYWGGFKILNNHTP